jgi:hypothetical protein
MASVRVRMLQTVTVGQSPTWPAGSVQLVSSALAEVMVRAGEAVYVGAGLDSTVALGAVVTRIRGLH